MPVEGAVNIGQLKMKIGIIWISFQSRRKCCYRVFVVSCGSIHFAQAHVWTFLIKLPFQSLLVRNLGGIVLL